MRVRILMTTAALVVACGGDDEDAGTDARQTTDRSAATAFASSLAQPTAEQLEAGRLDGSWRSYADADARERAAARGSGQSTPDVRADSGATSPVLSAAPASTDTTASWDQISPGAANGAVTRFPVGGDIAGPSVLRVQILLDRVRFRPGVIDGRWGKNTEKAVYWFQSERGLEATGVVDRRTLERLEGEAGSGEVVVSHTLTEADVAGPFEDLPEDVYARAEQDCLCYESLREKLGEVFHTAPELLEQLNPGVPLEGVSAGNVLQVPNVETFHTDALPEGSYTGGGPVARIAISDGGHYLHALADDGAILYHFPTTLGSDYAPSPSGEFSVESVTFDPTWHYQPDLLTGVDPARDDAVLPEGPNNAVGIVWMQLSQPHYGIHGTGAPASIGYVTSHGCVRLTNWDAGLLGRSIAPGTPVVFRDVTDG